MSFGIDPAHIRRDRFLRSPFATHLRMIGTLTLSTLICYVVVFAPVVVIWFLLGGNK